MDDGWHDLAVSGAVASQLVGDEPPGWPALPLQQLTKEAFSGSPIASRLDEDIDDVAILVHRTPEILPLTLDGYKHLVQVPRIVEATLPSLQLRAYSGPNLIHQSRIASYETVIPRWARRSSTSRKLRAGGRRRG